MGRSLSSVWDFVTTDLALGRISDVDAYCARCAQLFPQFTPKEFRREVIAVVCAFGSCAVEGVEDSLPPDEPYEDGDLLLSR